jgi:hypothetical protein
VSSLSSASEVVGGTKASDMPGIVRRVGAVRSGRRARRS